MNQFYYSILVFLFLFIATANAYSCECAESKQSQEFNRSTAVFTGEFVRLNDSDVEFKIIKTWKGVEAGQSILLENIDLIGCNYDLKLISGKSYLIYAIPTGREKLFISVDCGRSRAIEDAASDIKNMSKLAKIKSKPT